MLGSHALPALRAEKGSNRRCDLRLCPKPDMPKNAINVAIEGKADMAYCVAHVRLLPKAALQTYSKQL
jgi:hypothetical protein